MYHAYTMLIKDTELYSPLRGRMITHSCTASAVLAICTSTDQWSEFHNNQHEALQPGKKPDTHMFIELFN